MRPATTGNPPLSAAATIVAFGSRARQRQQQQVALRKVINQ